MSDMDMTTDAIAAELNKLNGRFDQIDARIEHIEENMVRKSDVFQAVMTVQGLFAAAIVGTVVVLNAVGAFG
jgi:tetrahydromethanopterin S-methyltransferase subunit G